jgi:hypothetical protein
LDLLNDEEQVIYFKKILEVLSTDDLDLMKVLINKPALMENLSIENFPELFAIYCTEKYPQYNQEIINQLAKNAKNALEILNKCPNSKEAILDALSHFSSKEEQIEVLGKLLSIDQDLPNNKVIKKLLAENPLALRKPNIFQYVIRENVEILFDHVKKYNKFVSDLDDWEIISHWKPDKKQNIYHVEHYENEKAYIFLINGSDAAELMSDEEKEDFEILIEKSNKGDWPVARLRYKYEIPGAKIKPTSFAWRRDINNNDKIIGIDVNFPVRGFISLTQLSNQTKTELGLNTKNEQDNDFMSEMKDNLVNFIQRVELVRFNGQNRWVMNIVE